MTSWLGMKKSSAIFRDFAGASVLLEVDADFAEGGRLRPVLEEVRENLRAGRLEDLP